MFVLYPPALLAEENGRRKYPRQTEIVTKRYTPNNPGNSRTDPITQSGRIGDAFA